MAEIEKRHEYWNHFIERYFVERFGGGSIVTGPRLRKVKAQIMADDRFWFNVIDQHGGQDKTPEQMRADDRANYEHCLGNFWGMLIAIIDGHREDL